MKVLMTSLFVLAVSSGAFAAGMYGGLEENQDLSGHVIFDVDKNMTRPAMMGMEETEATAIPPGIGYDTEGGVLFVEQWQDTTRPRQQGRGDCYGSVLLDVNPGLGIC
jgi:hypothetical protein